MTDDMTETEKQSSPENTSVGAELLARREQMGMTLADASRELRLSESIIGALEKEDLNALPPATFIRGYLRNYCRLLELDEEAVLQRYKLVGAAHPALNEITDSKVEPGSGHPVMLAFSLAIICFVGIGIWFYTTAGSNNKPDIATGVKPPLPAPQAETTTGTANLAPNVAIKEKTAITPTTATSTNSVNNPSGTEVAAADVSDQEIAVSQAEAATESVAETARNEVESEAPTSLLSLSKTRPEDLGEPPELLARPAVAETASVDNTEEEPQEQPVEPAPVEPIVEEANSEPVVTEALLSQNEEKVSDGVKDQFTISTDTESWVEISDSRDKRVLFGMLTSARDRTVTGVAPFKVFLGRAPGVAIVINGTEVDVPQGGTKRVARFTLESDGSHH